VPKSCVFAHWILAVCICCVLLFELDLPIKGKRTERNKLIVVILRDFCIQNDTFWNDLALFYTVLSTGVFGIELFESSSTKQTLAGCCRGVLQVAVEVCYRLLLKCW